ERFEKETYRAPVPASIDIRLSEPLSFQNLVILEDNGRSLSVDPIITRFSPERSIENAGPGYYFFRQEGVQTFVYFNPLDSTEGVNQPRRFVLKRCALEQLTPPITSINPQPLSAFNRLDTPFPRGSLSGVELNHRGAQPLRVGVGANGMNLFGITPMLQTFTEVYGINPATARLEGEQTRLFDALLDFFAAILREDSISPFRKVEEMIGDGRFHCGSMAELLRTTLNFLGIEAYRFGAANDWWGHVLLLVRHGDSRCAILSGYDRLRLDFCPGDQTINEVDAQLSMAAYHRSQNLEKVESYYSKRDAHRRDGTLYGWLANILTRGMYVLYPSTIEFKGDYLVFPLQPGDRLLLDPRGGRRHSLEVWESATGNPSGVAMLEWVQTSASFSRALELPFAARRVLIDGPETSRTRVLFSDGVELPVGEANDKLASGYIHEFTVTNLSPFTRVRVSMSFNPFMLPLFANDLFTTRTTPAFLLAQSPLQKFLFERQHEIISVFSSTAEHPFVVALSEEALDERLGIPPMRKQPPRRRLTRRANTAH
ncbi:MAG: hypothetical protein IT290_13200, partial [Deltaproteobacteria bacterium]|nr:hypothetical protein [Deltaproteobacteria bacterium]